jgi:alginate O-acetyltransferase complex protein AlgI
LLLLSFALPRRVRMPLVLIASYIFYATWSIPFIGVILFSTTFDYWMSRIIAGSASLAKRKTALLSGLGVNILVLFYFKYANFFLGSAHSLAHYLHLPLGLPAAINVILPLGISFYTFEAISYMVDVYRGEKPARSWLDYNFYIMYFPHLISGPIVRYKELASQYADGLELPAVDRLAKGSELIILGFLFKILIADQAAAIADPLFSHPQGATVLATYLGVLAFTVQIYFDFMGYTHIARGVSLFFNLEMPLNFNHPYNATTVSDFWNRWHMSLSRWIRDYLYFPLGGSRCALGRTLINLIVTMTICGFWHGAGWAFLAWGLYHGLLLAGYHLYKHTGGKQISLDLKTHPLYRVGAVALTFCLVALGWVFFRARSFGVAAAIIASLSRVDLLAGNLGHALSTGHLTDVSTLVVLLLCCFSGPWAVRQVQALYMPLPYWAKVKIACLLLLLCWIFSSEGAKTFIYFQF